MNLEKIETNLNKVAAMLSLVAYALEDGKLTQAQQSNVAVVVEVVAEIIDDVSEELG